MSTLSFTHGGFRFTVLGRHLEVHAGQIRLARLDLCPATAAAVRIGAFRREGDRIWASLEGGVTGRAVLVCRDGYVTYTVETGQKHFERLTYFPDGELDGDLWHSFVWAQRDRAWEICEDVEVRLGDTRPDIVDPREGVIVDPGDMPCYWPGRGCPRVCAAHHPAAGWWGLCIPGPLPVCDTWFQMQRRQFQIRFDCLRPGCEDGFMPTAVFVLPLRDPADPYSVMGPVWDLNAPWRLLAGRDYPKSRFEGLAMCHPWEAMQHAAGNAFAAAIPPAEVGSPMNSEFLLGLLRDLVAIEPRLKWHFPLPQGWFRNIGDYAVGANFGGEQGFRELADAFRQGGHLLTIHARLHHFNDRSEVGRAHPDWTARLRPGKPKPYWSANEEYEGVSEIMDVTRAEVREQLKSQVRRFLSADPGMLNMDGVQATGDHWPSALDYELADNDYGVGDLLAYKVNRELLLHGKAIKPDAFLCGTNNALYGLTEDASTMEDHLPIPIHTVQQLRLITSLYPDYQLHVASYCTTRTKSLTVWPLSTALGRPEIDNPRAFSNPHLNADWIELDEAYRRRLAAVLYAYANSPRTADTVNVPVRVEGEGLRLEVQAARKRTAGPLAGFYGALSRGSRIVVTYSESRAVVAATQSKTVTLPLPPGTAPESVVGVCHDGTETPHEYRMEAAGVTLHAPDAAGDVKVVEVRYR